MSQDESEFTTPRDEYVYSPRPVSIAELSAKWHTPGARDGFSRARLLQRCSSEGWVELRRSVQAESRSKADRMATDTLAEARVRLLQVARVLQDVGVTSLERYLPQDGGNLPAEVMRRPEAAIRAARVGADLEIRLRAIEADNGAEPEGLKRYMEILEKCGIRTPRE